MPGTIEIAKINRNTKIAEVLGATTLPKSQEALKCLKATKKHIKKNRKIRTSFMREIYNKNMQYSNLMNQIS